MKNKLFINFEKEQFIRHKDIWLKLFPDFKDIPLTYETICAYSEQVLGFPIDEYDDFSRGQFGSALHDLLRWYFLDKEKAIKFERIVWWDTPTKEQWNFFLKLIT